MHKRSCLCGCVYTRIRDVLCIGMLRAMYRDVLARRSPGKTTSRLSNYRSCIMHRSPHVPLALSFPFSLPPPLRISLSRLPLSRLIPSPPSLFYPRAESSSIARKQGSRGQSCGSAGISCGGDPLSDFLRRERAGAEG